MTLTASTTASTTAAPVTDEDRMRLIDHHATVEFAQDWDSAWETLDPEGSYDYFPLGIRVSGKENLQEHWRRLFAHPALKGVAETTLTRFVRDEEIILVTQAPVTMGDGQVRYSVSTAVFTFRGDKILRESVYCDDILQPLMEQILDEEFRSRPGVSLIQQF